MSDEQRRAAARDLANYAYEAHRNSERLAPTRNHLCGAFGTMLARHFPDEPSTGTFDLADCECRNASGQPCPIHPGRAAELTEAEALFEKAKRDDCFDDMVPSDLRQIARAWLHLIGGGLQQRKEGRGAGLNDALKAEPKKAPDGGGGHDYNDGYATGWAQGVTQYQENIERLKEKRDA